MERREQYLGHFFRIYEVYIVRATLKCCGDHKITQAGRGENQREKSKVPTASEPILYYTWLWSGPSLSAHSPCTTWTFNWPWVFICKLFHFWGCPRGESGAESNSKRQTRAEFKLQKWGGTEFQLKGVEVGPTNPQGQHHIFFHNHRLSCLMSQSILTHSLYIHVWKATNSHNNMLFQLSQKATMPSYLAQLVGTI